MSLNHEQSGRVRPYFSDFPLQVLARDTGWGQYDVSCDGTEDGVSVGCYTNSITALIDAAYLARAGQPGYRPRCAGSVDQALFYRPERRGLMADVRAAWPVMNRRIILRTDRGLSSVSREIRVSVSDNELPNAFEVDEAGLQWLDDIHERAGLFAWRDTVRSVASWRADWLARVVDRALGAIEVTVCEPSLCDEVALFDPESERWHFVPARNFLKKKYLRG